MHINENDSVIMHGNLQNFQWTVNTVSKTSIASSLLPQKVDFMKVENEKN